MCLGPGMQSHHRSPGPVDFVTPTLDANDLNQAAIDLTGKELTVAAGKVPRPPARSGALLLSTIEAGIRATGTSADRLASSKAADALERAFLRPMVSSAWRSVLAKRFEAAVEANVDLPLLIPDLCRLIGVSERTLRTLCREQLGLSPQRFLALRRLHLARRALLRSDGHSATVTEIAMDCGFWELGKFAAIYKSLFGESPSATLHRRARHSSRSDIRC